ncbi:MAG: hypothetical protein JSV91_12110 [Phycisphaerales bacterium]|nr:MAG: hypothetical protein JSV91_12110 [Phycisphaerales bacterium]
MQRTRFLRHFGFLSVILAACLVPAAFAAEVDVAQAIEDREKRAAASAEFVYRLGLARAQARKLIPVLEEAAAIHIQSYEAEAALLPRLIDAYTDFLQEDRLDKGFSPPVERRAGRLHQQEIYGPEGRTRQLMALEKKASAILKPDQRDFAEGFKPGKPYVKPKKKRTRDPLVAKRKELEELNRDKRPRLGRLGKLLLHPGAYPGICAKARSDAPEVLQRAARICANGTDECPIIRRDAMRLQVRQIRSEINNWNLINGLHFELDQIRQITEVYDRAVADVKLATGRTDPCNLLDQDAVNELEGIVSQILTPGQMEVIDIYKPCLIPPKNLKSPVRVGQAGDSSRMIHLLERARNVPQDRLADLAEQVIEGETRHYGKLADDDRLRRKRLLVNVARRARAMNDTEFELNKEDLATLIEREDRSLTLRGEIDDIVQYRGRAGLVARFIVNDEFMSQLKYRGQQLADGIEQKQANLAEGPQAENCDKGCAIKE